MHRRWLCFGFLVALLWSGITPAQVDRSAEVDTLLAGLASPSITARINAAKIISRSALIEPRLYARVAGLLEQGYGVASSAEQIDEMAWLCRALAASGGLDYRPLLDEVAMRTLSPKLQRYAGLSSGAIKANARRNRIVNAAERWDPALSADENRLLRLLEADDIGMKREAAKEILRRVRTDSRIYDASAAALTAMAQNVPEDPLYVDTLAWLCKVLAASGTSKYMAPLQQLDAATEDSKVKKYVSQALGTLREKAGKEGGGGVDVMDNQPSQ